MNSPTTGAPIITGTPREGGMLTVDLSGITDPEGTDDAEFTYQWARVAGDSEANIPNAHDLPTVPSTKTLARPSK